MGEVFAFALESRRGHNGPMPKGYISVKQAAERLGKSEQAVRNLCQRGRIKAERISDVWLIDEEAFQTFKPQREGRPNKK